MASSQIVPELQWVGEVLDSWEYISNEHLKLSPGTAPKMVFFDTAYVYSNTELSTPNGKPVNGPNFFGETLQWFRSKHNGSLILPDSSSVPIGIMSFAAPVNNNPEDMFFVMALPSFWELAGIQDNELGTDNLYTYIFLHEFSHIMQGQNFGKRLTDFESVLGKDVNLTDDIIQEEFAEDSLYSKAFDEELALFYKAFAASDPDSTLTLAQRGIDLYKSRQQRYFTANRTIYVELDDFFLTMEGMGQYLPVLWFSDSTKLNLGEDVFVKMKTGKGSWSQNEGLALFLLYNKISNPNLGEEMFGNEVHPIIDLLEEAVNLKLDASQP